MESSSQHSSKRTAFVAFALAILAVGLTRFTLTLPGVPDHITTFFSISVVIGGFTLEPWAAFAVMSVFAGIVWMVRRVFVRRISSASATN